MRAGLGVRFDGHGPRHNFCAPTRAKLIAALGPCRGRRHVGSELIAGNDPTPSCSSAARHRDRGNDRNGCGREGLSSCCFLTKSLSANATENRDANQMEKGTFGGFGPVLVKLNRVKEKINGSTATRLKAHQRTIGRPSRASASYRFRQASGLCDAGHDEFNDGCLPFTASNSTSNISVAFGEWRRGAAGAVAQRGRNDQGTACRRLSWWRRLHPAAITLRCPIGNSNGSLRSTEESNFCPSCRSHRASRCNA